MILNPYLSLNGQCAAAFKFYERALRGKLEMLQTFGETPSAEHVPPEGRDRIMHARLAVDNWVLMGSDNLPGQDEPVSGFSLSLNVADPAEAERVFNALADGGEVRMPLQETFWAARFGMLVDQFGVPWMVNCETVA